MLRCSCSVGALNFILKFWKTIKVEGLKNPIGWNQGRNLWVRHSGSRVVWKSVTQDRLGGVLGAGAAQGTGLVPLLRGLRCLLTALLEVTHLPFI